MRKTVVLVLVITILMTIIGCNYTTKTTEDYLFSTAEEAHKNPMYRTLATYKGDANFQLDFGG